MNQPKPVILQSKQFEQANEVNYQHECDCACSDSGFSLTTPPISSHQSLRCSNLHIQDLPHKHTLMFNPLYDSGMVVLNASAQQIWEQFQNPRTLQSLKDSHPNVTAPVVQKMLAAGLLEPIGAKVKPRKSSPHTLSAWLHVTNKCNLRCDYCYICKSNDDMSQEVGYASVDAIIRSAIKGGFKQIKLKFAGGEATLNLKLVFELHTYALQQTVHAGLKLDTVILSNGIALGHREIEEFKSRGIQVMISLDGVGEMHDAQRKFVNGQGSFAWVNRAIDKLLSHGVKPFISITISDRNAEGLPDVISYALDRDLPFNINFFRDTECAAPFADLQLRDERIIQAMRRAFAVIETKLPSHSLLGSLVDRAQFDRSHDKTCSVGGSYLVIDHRGNIAKCHMEIETPVTNVYANDPLALVRADKLGLQNISVEEKEGCRECEWQYWCTGGCPLLTFRTTGRYDVKSPYCNIYKAIYPEMLRLEGLRLLKLNGAPTI